MRTYLLKTIHRIAKRITTWTSPSNLEAVQPKSKAPEEAEEPEEEKEASEESEEDSSSESYYHTVHAWENQQTPPIIPANPNLIEPDEKELDAFLFRYDAWDVDEN
tara:strand:+ start:4445 stop:4762 length:318 start_codon:yes stop_codon:yes gene_type:complete